MSGGDTPVQRIGIFGGSFDPPHLGHVKLARAAVRGCRLDRLTIVPAARSPFKKGVFCSDRDRMEMCRLSFRGRGYAVSDFEVARGGVSYTVDTVAHFKERYPAAELWLLVGEDQLLSFDQWRAWRDLLSMAGLCAAVRTEGGNREALEAFAEERLRPYGGVLIMDFEPLPMSSTEIRQRIQKGEPIDGFVSPAVKQYILEKDLYRGL